MVFYPIKLQHEDLVPGSEVVTIAGGQFVALVRDEDYTIDYQNGILSIDLDAAVSFNLMPDEDLPIDVSYRYQVDFEQGVFLESHVEQVNEVAAITDLLRLRTSNSPITDVFRVFNKTTREEYTVETFMDDTIIIDGENPPSVVSLTRQPTSLSDRVFDVEHFENTITLQLADAFSPASEHPISTVDTIRSTTSARELIQGGVDAVETSYQIEITRDVTGIVLLTGSTLFRRSTTELTRFTDYVTTVSEDGQQLTISLTDLGIEKIGTNSLFYRLQKIFSPLSNAIDNEQHTIQFNENYISEVAVFSQGQANLVKLTPFIEAGQEIDNLIFPSLVVTNQSGTVGYIQGRDFYIDTALRRLIRIESSPTLSPDQVVRVAYVDQQQYSADITIAEDVVIVDYTWGTNSLDWSPSIQDTLTQQQVQLKEGARGLTLDQFPANDQVTVTLLGQQGSALEIEVNSVDIVNRRVSIQPAPISATYTVTYTARKQVFDPQQGYYCTYKYGARKRALQDNWAALLGLQTGTVARQEVFDLINNQSSQVLSDAPISIEDVQIYLTGDPDKSPLATATRFNQTTSTLEFTPITSAGNYTIEYTVSGFETQQLRTAILALIQAFLTGPTQQSVENIGEAFTGLVPEVIDSIDNGFDLSNDETGDFLNPLPPTISPALSDGSNSIEFEPSRFANGLAIKSVNDSFVGYNALSNISSSQGTIQFLLGNRWDGNDGLTHRLFDTVGTDEFTNRITCYKNKKGRLAFEIHDANSKLFRVTSDITRLPRYEIRYLEAGDATTTLDYSPAYTIEDLNANGQSDIFEANRTEFVITPLFNNLEGLGLNITTVVQIPNDEDYTDQPTFMAAASKLRALAGAYANNGGKITVQTESLFIEGCRLYDNVLLDLQNNGHSINLLVDFPMDVISDADREAYILERRNSLGVIGIQPGDSDGIAGGYQIHNFATVFPSLGLDYASAYIDPISGDTIQNRTDVFRASIGPDFTIPDPDGQLVFLPGDATINFQKQPLIVQSFIPITNALLDAIDRARPDVINCWYFTIGLHEFTEPEVALFDSWLSGTVQPLVDAGQVAWRPLTDIYQLFLQYEEFLLTNRNRVRFVTESYGAYGDLEDFATTQPIRALSWDNLTNTLTFDPVDQTGFYLFSYISGFSNYDEAEHMLTCTWKLTTDDGQPAYTRMFLDGELIAHRLWGDV